MPPPPPNQHSAPSHPTPLSSITKASRRSTSKRQRPSKRVPAAMDRQQKRQTQQLSLDPGSHSPPSSSRDADPASAKVGRLSKACDGCSVRKVKCDEQGPPCRACRSLNIPCTFNRPTRRRGPPNKYAKSLERARVSPSPASVASSSDTAASPSTFGFASVCPPDLLNLLLYDFFTYVYPLVPFPHEHWFRAQLTRTTEPRFFGLVAVVVGTVAANQPRRTLKHLQDLDLTYLHPTSYDFAQQCVNSALKARGCHILSKSDLCIWDAITSFYLGRIHATIWNNQTAELYVGESLNIVRALGYDRSNPEEDPNLVAAQSNILTQQMGRRLYWALFKIFRANVCLASNESLGRIPLNPPTPFYKHPPFAESIDDEYLSTDRIGQQPEGILPAMAGFNASVQIFLAHDPIAALDLSFAIDETVDRATQCKVLARGILEAEEALHQIPNEYTLASGSNILLERILANEYPQDQGTRRAIAIALQKADIHMSYFTTRSYIFEKFWSVSAGADGAPIQEHLCQLLPRLHTFNRPAERLFIARGLLHALGQVPMLLQEGFASHIGLRVRQIASTLLPYTGGEDGQSTPADVSPDVAQEAASLVREFVAFLVRLDQGRRDSAALGLSPSAAVEVSVWGSGDDMGAEWSEGGPSQPQWG